uniref:Uncharacterized protein n=1 Tax=Panagrolaimus sp. PS1159 TaxID=55785 RepID=A0AC35FRI4_9BILA
MPRIYLKLWLILLLMAAYQSQRVQAIIHDAPNIYHWMERNSYICDPFIPSKPDNPIFIFEEEAEIFKCSTLCGDPIESKKACGRMRSQPDSDPSCFTIPEICIKEYIHEFTTTSHNGEKVDEIKENFDFETKEEVDQNNLEPVDLAVVNKPIVSNNAETNANELQTSDENLQQPQQPKAQQPRLQLFLLQLPPLQRLRPQLLRQQQFQQQPLRKQQRPLKQPQQQFHQLQRHQRLLNQQRLALQLYHRQQRRQPRPPQHSQ